jgi:hypothetical protein
MFLSQSLSFFPKAFLIGAVVIGTSQVALSQTSKWQQYRLTLTSYGPVSIGMTPKQASKALGTAIIPLKGSSSPDPNACNILWPNGDSKSPVSFMVTNHRISRIDILKSPAKTISGIGIGVTEKQLKETYKQNIYMQPNKYDPKSHNFIYKPSNSTYKPYSMIFETNGKTVTQFRAGKKEEVSYSEACS